jgi:hypothetical protein
VSHLAISSTPTAFNFPRRTIENTQLMRDSPWDFYLRARKLYRLVTLNSQPLNSFRRRKIDDIHSHTLDCLLVSLCIFYPHSRSKNERFFMVGMLVINLIERCSNVVAASSKRNNNNSRRNAAHSLAMSELLQEATELRSTLLSVSSPCPQYLQNVVVLGSLCNCISGVFNNTMLTALERIYIAYHS